MFERLAMDIKDIPQYFPQIGGGASITDVIVYVREKYPDPRQAILLETETVLPEEELANDNIFLSETALKAANISGVSDTCACVLNFDKIENTTPDAIELLLNQFSQQYYIEKFSIYVIGQDTQKIYQFVQDVSGHPVSDRTIRYPNSVWKLLRQKENGIDIWPLASYIQTESGRNGLRWEQLERELDKYEAEICSGGKEVQCLSPTRNKVVKYLMTYFNMLPGIQPANLRTFVFDQITTQFMYPYGKLSMYERIMFLRNMPWTVGYCSLNNDEVALLQIADKVYPTPVFVYIVEQNKLIEFSKLPDSMKALFHPSTISETIGGQSQIIDSRLLFPGSKECFPEEAKTIKYMNAYSDLNIDEKWADIFSMIEDAWITHQFNMKERGAAGYDEPEPAYLSFKNSYLVKVSGSKSSFSAIVYCKDTLGIFCKAYSEACTSGVAMLIQEENFNQLVDPMIARQSLTREYERIVGKTSLMQSSYSTALSTETARLQPAVPLRILLAMHLLPTLRNGLSFYDKLLRCRADILPIVLDKNSRAYDKSKLFDIFSLQSLRKDPAAKRSISSFGTVRGFENQRLLVTYHAFEQMVDLL